MLFLFSSADCTSQGSSACATDDSVCTTGADFTKLKCVAPAAGYHSVDADGFSQPCTSQGSSACATDGSGCTTGRHVTTLACAAPAFGYSVDSDGFASPMCV